MAIKSIWELAEFKPLAEQWQARQALLFKREGYYDGSVYAKASGALGWLGPRINQAVKPLYLPLARAVDVDAGIVPGEWAFAEDAPDAWQDARDVLFAWSGWKKRGVLYVHYGAVYGVSGLKVSDLRAEKRVMVRPVNPLCYMLVPNADGSDGVSVGLTVEQRTDEQGPYEYAEVVTPESIRTFRNGEPFGFAPLEAEYKNELGFVPMVEVPHMEVGAALGESTYEKTMPLLDEVNKLATYLAEIVAKHSEPQWAVSGAEGTDLVKSGDNVWFLPSGATATPLVAGVDIGGVLEFVREIREQVFGSLPELAFDELKKANQIATATLELQLMELVLKIKRVRPNYDDGLVRALRMAGQAAASMGVSEVSALDDEALTLDETRPVLPMDKETELKLEKMQMELEQQQKFGSGNY